MLRTTISNTPARLTRSITCDVITATAVTATVAGERSAQREAETGVGFQWRMTNLFICEIPVRCVGVPRRRLLSAPGFPDSFYATREVLFNYMACNIAKELEGRKRESVSLA